MVRAGLRDDPGPGHVPSLGCGGARLRRRPDGSPLGHKVIGLHHHEANPGQPFSEGRTGLDRIAFGVAGRSGLDAWAGWLDELGPRALPRHRHRQSDALLGGRLQGSRRHSGLKKLFYMAV